MNKVLHATYHNGNLILDEKLDAALEGQKLTLILVEEPVASTSTETNLEERKQKFLEKLKTYSIKLPEDYKFNREQLYDRQCFH